MAPTVIHRSYASSPTYIMAQIIWTVTGIIEGLLGLRFLLQLFGANTSAPFTNFIYTLSQPFLVPFANMFRSVGIPSFGTLNWNLIIAMIAYALVAWAIVRLLSISPPTDHIDYVERM